jgi:flagellar hook-basal body complex protein FliE
MIVNVERIQTAATTLPLQVNHPKHIALFENGVPVAQGSRPVSSFEDLMLKKLDGVSGDQLRASSLMEAAILEPDSVDIHDVTIAQAKASMSLNIARTVLNRLVQSWKDIANTR